MKAVTYLVLHMLVMVVHLAQPFYFLFYNIGVPFSGLSGRMGRMHYEINTDKWKYQEAMSIPGKEMKLVGLSKENS